MIVLISRSLVATSCSIGVKRKKFSRLNNVTVTSRRRRSSFGNSNAVYIPPNPPPRINTRHCLPLALTVFRNAIFHGLHLLKLQLVHAKFELSAPHPEIFLPSFGSSAIRDLHSPRS